MEQRTMAKAKVLFVELEGADVGELLKSFLDRLDPFATPAALPPGQIDNPPSPLPGEPAQVDGTQRSASDHDAANPSSSAVQQPTAPKPAFSRPRGRKPSRTLTISQAPSNTARRGRSLYTCDQKPGQTFTVKQICALTSIKNPYAQLAAGRDIKGYTFHKLGSDPIDNRKSQIANPHDLGESRPRQRSADIGPLNSYTTGGIARHSPQDPVRTSDLVNH
jgi:hypothetical protein